MSALTPIGRPVMYSAGNAPIDRERQAEQDDERGDERVEGQDHHHVDEQDGDAHRGEQPAERLVLLLGDAGQRRPSTPAGIAPVGLERVDLLA